MLTSEERRALLTYRREKAKNIFEEANKLCIRNCLAKTPITSETFGTLKKRLYICRTLLINGTEYRITTAKAVCFSVFRYLYTMGLYGFDGKTKWYVSMRSVGGWLLNLSYRTINWRKQLRSRCLIEVQ